jgi:hypothetical protein
MQDADVNVGSDQPVQPEAPAPEAPAEQPAA